MSDEKQNYVSKVVTGASGGPKNKKNIQEELQCNFSMELVEFSREIDSRSIYENYAEIKFIISYQDKTEEILAKIPLSSLDTKTVLKYIPSDCIINGSQYQKRKYISYIINNELCNQKSPKEKYLLEPGYNLWRDKRIFVLGDRIINSPDDYEFIIKNQFPLKSFSSYRNYLEWINRIFNAGIIFPALIMSALTSFLRPLYNESGIPGSTDFSVYVYGESGYFKTETVRLITDLFENHKNCVSLASDKKSLLALSQLNDMIVNIDDLCKTDSVRVRESNEKKLHDMVHQKSTHGAIEVNGKDVKVNCTIFFTAEYLIKNHSTLNRCLVAEFPHIEPDTLTWLQNNHPMYIRFILDYIEWICKNYLKLCDNIRVYKEICKNNSKEKLDQFEGINRIKRMEMILKITARVFIEFFHDEFDIVENDLQSLSETIDRSIQYCIASTCEAVRKESDELHRDYVDVILDIFAWDFHGYVVNSFKKYKKANKNADKDSPVKLFFRENDCYCIKGTHLEKIYAETKNFPYKFSKKAISAQLKKFDLLESYGGELSFMRRNQPDYQNPDKTRYYHIRVSKIIELMSDDQKNIASIHSPLKELNTYVKYGDIEKYRDDDYDEEDDEFSYDYDEEDYRIDLGNDDDNCPKNHLKDFVKNYVNYDD